MKQRIMHCFNKGAQTYHLAGGLQANVAAQLAKRLVPVAGNKILEIGCGTGLFSQKLATHFPQGALLLTDIAPAMLKICEKNLRDIPHLTFECHDGEKLNIATSFDLIASSMTLHWFTNITTSIASIIKKLSPNGSLVFSMLGKNSLNEWRDICNKFNLPIPIPVFPSYNDLQNHFPTMKIEVKTVQYEYQNSFDFLNSFKKIGATATCENYSVLTAGALRRVLRQLNSKMIMSYEVIYGHYVK